MQTPIAERIKKLRQEIADIRELTTRYLERRKSPLETANNERRLERVQQIMGELTTMTDWKKP